jgi:hypothetical protein
MVAYSFQRRFVAPICKGLGREVPPGFFNNIRVDNRPKLHTIRAERKRHARPGEVIQLYYAQRTKHCMSIGVARCTEVLPIVLIFDSNVVSIGASIALSKPRELEEFAQSDGFENWEDMREFWSVHQHGLHPFHGVIIYWEAA